MKINLRNDVTILNIFKDELEFAKGFIDHHKDMVKQIIMLNTGNYGVYEQIEQYASQYENILVNYRDFETVDFSSFRNAARRYFDESTPFILWVDTDEIVLAAENEIDFDSRCDVGGIIRNEVLS